MTINTENNTRITHSSWQKDFTIKYEIRLSRRKNAGDRKALYNALKADLIATFNEINAENPNSEILIRFDDTNLRIKIGYEYPTFLDLVSNPIFHRLPKTEDKQPSSENSFSYKNNDSEFEVRPYRIKTISSAHTHNAHWHKNFQAAYKIQISKNKDVKDPTAHYNTLKAELLTTFNEIHAENPNFRVFIRFDDTNLCIDIGYAYKNFLDLVSPTAFQLLPKMGDGQHSAKNFIYKNNDCNFEVFAQNFEINLAFNNGNAHWKKDFTTTYKIAFFKTEDPIGKKIQYYNFKDYLIETFNKLHAENPNFEILIRLNDHSLDIDIGYAYRDFLALISDYAPYALPHPNSAKISGPPIVYSSPNISFEVSANDKAHDVLKSSKDGQPFAFNYSHQSFWDKVSDSLREPAERFKNLPPSHSTKTTFISDFAQVFQDQNKPLRLIMGENHLYPDARSMIRDAIKSGAIPPGTTIALEWGFYERHQKILDQWMQSPQDTPPPVEFKYLLSNKIFSETIFAAKERKLRVLLIDTEAITNLSPIKRAKAMNYIAKAIIQNEVGNGAFVALVGATHAVDTTITSHGTTEKIPGLGSLLDNVSSTLVVDTTLPSPLSFNKALTYCIPEIKIDFEPSTILKATRIPRGQLLETTQEFEERIAREKVHTQKKLTFDNKGTKHDSDTSKSLANDLRSPTDLQGDSYQRTHDILIVPDINSRTPPLSPSIQQDEPPQQKFVYKNTIISGGMLIFGGAGAINSLKKGDTFNGISSLSETASGVIGLSAGLLSNKGQEVLQMFSNTPALKKVASQIIKSSGQLLKIIPFAGTIFAAIAAKQDIDDVISASKSGNVVGIVKAAVNLVLDVAMGVADLVPGVGTLASLSLLTARITAGLLIEQICDPEAYKQTWALLEEPNSTWFDKMLSAAGGALQFSAKLSIMPSFASSMLEKAKRVQEVSENLNNHKKKADEIKKIKIFSIKDLEHIVKVSDVTAQEARVLDFSPLYPYKNSGSLTFKIGTGGETVSVQQSGETRKITLGTTKSPIVYVKMGLGANFDYKEKLINKDGTDYQHQKPQGNSIPYLTFGIHAESSSHALTTQYYAPDDDTNVIFIAPPGPRKGLLPVFNANDFHHEIHGGKGINIYKLGNQQTTIYCGSGKNVIEIPFDQETEARTITLKDFRTDNSCFLTLQGIRVDFELFQKAKIGIDKNSSLFLQFGSTKIDFGTSNRKTLFIRTDDGVFDIDTQRLQKDHSPEAEKELKDYISVSMISHMSDNHINIIEKNLVSLKENKNQTFSFSDYKEDGAYFLSLRHINKDSTLFKNAQISFSKLGELNLSFGNTNINFRAKNVKFLTILTDDHFSFFDLGNAKKAGIAPFDCAHNQCIQEPSMLIHAGKRVWKILNLRDYRLSPNSDTGSHVARYDNKFHGTPGKDSFIFDAKTIGKTTLKDFSLTGGDTLQIINADNDSDVANNAVQHGDDVVITFDPFNELTLISTKLSDLKHFIRKPAFYGLSGETDEFFIDAKKIGHMAIKNFSFSEHDVLRILNTSDTKETLLKKTLQKDRDVVISFDAFNELTLENVQLSSLQQANYEYLLLDVAA